MHLFPACKSYKTFAVNFLSCNAASKVLDLEKSSFLSASLLQKCKCWKSNALHALFLTKLECAKPFDETNTKSDLVSEQYFEELLAQRIASFLYHL